MTNYWVNLGRSGKLSPPGVMPGGAVIGSGRLEEWRGTDTIKHVDAEPLFPGVVDETIPVKIEERNIQPVAQAATVKAGRYRGTGDLHQGRRQIQQADRHRQSPRLGS